MTFGGYIVALSFVPSPPRLPHEDRPAGGYGLVLRHKTFTGSSRANHILSNWEEYLPKFRKVMPIEYRKALAQMERERAALQAAAE